MSDVQSTEVEVIWAELSAGIRDVYSHRQMSPDRFMQLYTHVYNYCTKTPNGTGTGSGSDSSGGGSRRSGRAQRNRGGQGVTPSSNSGMSGFVGHDLYQRIRELLKTYLTDLTKNGKDKMGEDLLTFYLTQWERYTFSSKVMNGFCSYLNRHWIRREVDEGREHVYQIYQLALDIWKEKFFEPLHGSAVTTMLQLIKRDRNGENINAGMIKGINDSLIELGKDRSVQESSQNQNQTDDLGIYQTRFEDAFIGETDNFYTLESTAFLHSGKSVSEYMKKVEQRINEERRRVGLYLHKSSLDRLMRTVENVLIEKQLMVLHEEFPILLRARSVDDMGRMYDLVARVGDAFGNMRETLQDHIANEGSSAILQNRELCTNDPREYIKTILVVYNKFSQLCNVAFKQDPGFVASLDRACGIFINQNALTKDSRSAHKSPEMLARYCDSLLKKTGKNYDDHELEDMLNQSMIIFKYLEDKDVFQKYYSRMLASRLVGNLSASDDAESSMITKLKLACGFEYTTKLQRMFQDVGLAKDMNDDFRQWLTRQEIAEPMKVDFYMLILSSGSWPFTVDTNDTFLLPQVLEPCLTIFSQYYGEMHTGRKLNWLYSKSRGEVVSHCFSSTYTFVLSTYSIAVLLQYNLRDSYRLHELVEATQLREDLVTQIVQLLMKEGLLKSDDDKDKLFYTSEIYLYPEYKSKRLKVSLMVPLKIEVKLEDERAQSSIEEGRVHEVQAAIVRIMKARKALEHQQLVSETINLLKNRFAPSVVLIKRCIEKLIEKEYLERRPEEQNVYHYRA